LTVFGLLSAVLVWFGRGGSPAKKAALYGATAGILYGLSASLWKPTSQAIDADGLSGMLTTWEFYAFAAAGILAFVVQQISLATGKLASSVATVSVCNPIVSIVIGILVLQETLSEPTWHKVVAYVGLGVALVGAIIVTRATEGQKEQEVESIESGVPAPAPTS
jgi:drug/metabolite transporter (DMT)-like permease